MHKQQCVVTGNDLGAVGHRLNREALILFDPQRDFNFIFLDFQIFKAVS